MNSNLFKIKFSFKERNENGKEIKSKLEVIAQCANYTDAEKLMATLSCEYEMDKIEPFSYEIIKLKLSVHDILYTRAINYQKGELYCGLVQNYFENETSNIYIVNITIFGDNSNVKAAYCVPAEEAADAIKYVKSKMASNSYNESDYAVISAKMDNALELYLTPDTQETMLKSIDQNGL